MSEAKLKTKDRLAILFLLAQHRLFSTKNGEKGCRPKCKIKNVKKFEKFVNILLMSRCNCEVFPKNALTLTCPYCMLTKGINDADFRIVTQFYFPLQYDDNVKIVPKPSFTIL